MSDAAERPDLDAIVVGAGFAGLYMLHKLRGQGMSVRVLESADGVGGTWYWNRYPGARCDIISIDYSYSFDAELQKEWKWSERYATQPEILRYLIHVADRFDLRRDIRFDTRVAEAAWDGGAHLWRIMTEAGEKMTARHYIMATGCLSVPKDLDIDGLDDFEGEVYFTSRWPHEPVDFTGKRVGVVGTGSSGIQVIPKIAKQAASLTVFQRTPNFSIPARNGPLDAALVAQFEKDPDAYREAARNSMIGVPGEMSQESAMAVSEDERQRRYEDMWQKGTLHSIFAAFGDLIINPASNEAAAEFVRNKIRSIVNDPEVAETLVPNGYPFVTKRPCLDDGYFAAFNQPNVTLVDLKKDPIEAVTETGIRTVGGAHEFDALVFATGFDAMTGAVVNVNIRGRDGLALAEKWADGPRTYMGMTVAGFPNFFLITGPGSPSVLSNMAVSIEQHVEWIANCLKDMAENGQDVIDASSVAEEAWGTYVNDAGDMTLYPQANSWYMGANVPGKPRVFLPFIGGVDAYRRACNDIRRQRLSWASTCPARAASRRSDGDRPALPARTCRWCWTCSAASGLPPLESLDHEGLRAVMAGHEGTIPAGARGRRDRRRHLWPGAAGEMAYRLYRPATPGPHPVVLYFHGGGWVIGAQDSDDPLCRDLCVRSNAVIVSCDYRHAPEVRFPGAVEDAVAALDWVGAERREARRHPGSAGRRGLERRRQPRRGRRAARAGQWRPGAVGAAPDHAGHRQRFLAPLLHGLNAHGPGA